MKLLGGIQNRQPFRTTRRARVHTGRNTFRCSRGSSGPSGDGPSGPLRGSRQCGVRMKFFPEGPCPHGPAPSPSHSCIFRPVGRRALRIATRITSMWRKDEIFPGGPVSTRAGTRSAALVDLPARQETGPPVYSRIGPNICPNKYSGPLRPHNPPKRLQPCIPTHKPSEGFNGALGMRHQTDHVASLVAHARDCVTRTVYVR